MNNFFLKKPRQMGIELSYGLLTPNFILRRHSLHPLCIGCGAILVRYKKSSSECWDSRLVGPTVLTIAV